MTSEAPVIHVVDDDPSFRKALARLLKTAGYQVALYESGAKFLEAPPDNRPGCILLDLKMSEVSGLELQDRLARLENLLPIVFVTGHGDLPTGVKAVKAGAEDFLTKPVTKRTLLETIERALTRYAEKRSQHDRLDALRALVAQLNSRERDVFALVIRGKLNKQIAHELGMAERTVKAHRHTLMEKLKVRSLAEAVAIAERLGMLSETKQG